MFDFISKNFVVFSAALLLTGSTLTMLFLTVYLSVFDWTLVWLIEYSDLTKFFLLAAALISLSTLLVSQFIPHLDIWLSRDLRFRAAFLAISLLIMFGGQLWSIWTVAHLGPSDELTYRILLLVSSGALFFMFWRFRKSLSRWRVRDIRLISTDVAIVAACIALFAITFAFYVKYASALCDITLKQGAFREAKIILLLSHHTAFVSAKRLYVVPTGDIVEISAPIGWKDAK